MKPIKLAIVDDQLLFLKGLKLLVNSFDDIELIIEANDGKELLEAITLNLPHVILMDLNMREIDGLKATEIIKKKYPSIKIIVLSMYDEEALINHMMKIGANGYLLKNEEPDVVKEAIYTVMDKGFFFNDYVSKSLLKGIKSPKKEFKSWKIKPNLQLTKRELEVLSLICKEYKSAEIAKQLFISVRTVENHRKSLLSKTGVRNSVGLMAFAVRNKLIDLDDFGIDENK